MPNYRSLVFSVHVMFLNPSNIYNNAYIIFIFYLQKINCRLQNKRLVHFKFDSKRAKYSNSIKIPWWNDSGSKISTIKFSEILSNLRILRAEILVSQKCPPTQCESNSKFTSMRKIAGRIPDWCGSNFFPRIGKF